MTLQHTRPTAAAVAIITAMGAALAGCAQQAPMALACEPNQRALVRQVVTNGAPQTELRCETAGPSAMAASASMTTPATAIPIGYAQAPLADARLVPASYTLPPTAATERVAYQPARERRVVSRPKRSVAKSAVIIGSSAGVAAGIGAAIGGKKGAGIGALVGGGGAALWDQLTRNK